MPVMHFSAYNDILPSGQQQGDACAEQHEDGFINLLQSQHTKRDGEQDAEHIFLFRILMQEKGA